MCASTCSEDVRCWTAIKDIAVLLLGKLLPAIRRGLSVPVLAFWQGRGIEETDLVNVAVLGVLSHSASACVEPTELAIASTVGSAASPGGQPTGTGDTGEFGDRGEDKQLADVTSIDLELGEVGSFLTETRQPATLFG